MISVFKPHLQIHFYRLLYIAVSILCCLIGELIVAILLIFIVCNIFLLQLHFLALHIFCVNSATLSRTCCLFNDTICYVLFSSSGMLLYGSTSIKNDYYCYSPVINVLSPALAAQ